LDPSVSEENYTAVLPALTDRVDSSRFGARFRGALGAPGQVIPVLDSGQLEGMPGPVSVHLFRPDRAMGYADWVGGVLVDAALTVDAHARVTYSNGAAQNTFYCDWDAQFSVVCSRISIELEVYLLHSAWAYTAPVGVIEPRTFGALIGLGACPSGGADAVSFTSPGIAAGSFLVPAVYVSQSLIPDFARRWLPMVSALGIASFSPDDLAGFTATIYTTRGTPLYDSPLTRAIMETGIPLPGGAAYVQVLCPLTVGSCSIFHLFRLGL
jgi:hypothetical protein